VNQKRSAGPNGEDAPGFEASLERLESIVQELESGELTLEQSLERYEEGMRLSQRLTRTLEEAERRIERLGEEGAPPQAKRPEELGARPAARENPAEEGELPL
jgi:exodeoxyribonuclease VII small subunit